MARNILLSYNIRAWDTTKKDNEEYLHYVVVDRLKNSDNKSSIRIVETITKDCFLNRFKDGCTLSLIEGVCEDPNVFMPKDIILEFRNCILVDSRIANLGAMTSADIGKVEMYAVIDCDAFGRFDKQNFVAFDSKSLIEKCISCDQLYNHERFTGGCPSCGSPQE